MAKFPILLHPLCLVLLIFPILALAQSSNGTIDVNSSLTATDNGKLWLSPAEDFAFGFKKLNNSKDQFLLSIWYNKIPDTTIVWFGNDGNTVEGGSKVQLTADRGLVVSDSKGNELWNSGSLSDQVSHALFNNTGNFMLLRSDSTKLWESFSNPTDTLLPTQIMETGGVLYSRRTETNFSKGRFQLRFLEDGNLVLNTRDVSTNNAYGDYYSSGTVESQNANNSGYQVFTGTPNWLVSWQEPDNICSYSGDLGSGACGYNSYCTLDDSKRPFCQCPEGYSLLDPDDRYGSCKPSFSQSCDDDNGQSSADDLYDFSALDDSNWPTSDYEHLSNISEQDCKGSCLNDCFCAVAVYGIAGGCWKKKLPLSNGRKGIADPGKVFFKKFKKGELPPQSPKEPREKDHGTLILVLSLLLGSSFFVNVLFIGASSLAFFGINQKKPNIQPGNNISETNIRCFGYKELAEATKGFTEELGRGAFGIVYKGIVQTSTSDTVIAVKKLDRVTQDTDKEFKTEVNVIAQTHHKNLVRLVGFCDEREHRLLVYEYMVNGTLSSFAFGVVKPSWTQRSRIVLGIARGLAYLHEECSTQIIHCDIKPQNILLDEYYNARISDFGLAKLLMMNQSRTNTGIRGTKGYVAPEWFRNMPITTKVDVYSFGVMLLEIVCCRRNVEDLENGGERDILTDWVWDCFQDGRLDDLVEYDKELVLYELEKVEKFVMVGMWCIQEDPCLRPTMREVIRMLEGVVVVPKPPCPSPFL